MKQKWWLRLCACTAAPQPAESAAAVRTRDSPTDANKPDAPFGHVLSESFSSEPSTPFPASKPALVSSPAVGDVVETLRSTSMRMLTPSGGGSIPAVGGLQLTAPSQLVKDVQDLRYLGQGEHRRMSGPIGAVPAPRSSLPASPPCMHACMLVGACPGG